MKITPTETEMFFTVTDPRLSPVPESNAIPFRMVPAPRRKRVAFRLDSEGMLELLVPPPGLTGAAAAEIVSRNRDLIQRMKARFRRQAPAPVYAFTEGEFFPLWGKRLKLEFSSRLSLIDGEKIMVPGGSPAEVRERLTLLYRKTATPLLREKCRLYGAPFGLAPKLVRVGEPSSRWGSCSSSGTISFCWKLLLMPEILADYVVCHELAHLRHLDHSAAFWALTERLMPGAREKRARLKALPELWPTAPGR